VENKKNESKRQAPRMVPRSQNHALDKKRGQESSLGIRSRKVGGKDGSTERGARRVTKPGGFRVKKKKTKRSRMKRKAAPMKIPYLRGMEQIRKKEPTCVRTKDPKKKSELRALGGVGGVGTLSF